MRPRPALSTYVMTPYPHYRATVRTGDDFRFLRRKFEWGATIAHPYTIRVCLRWLRIHQPDHPVLCALDNAAPGKDAEAWAVAMQMLETYDDDLSTPCPVPA